jgi:serine/threonine protein kinase
MMNPTNTLMHDPLSEPTAQDAELTRLLEECLADLEAGRPVDLERLLADHADVAERLQTCLGALNLVQQATAELAGRQPQAAPLAVGRLGDFDIIREVGRGGMGVVYEAQQISLGRKVALKVLPFAATLDPRQLQRFLLEAQAAAILHHVHIVPIYSVGSERGVHYYAMQFIDGQTLADAIADLRRLSQEGAARGMQPARSAAAAASTATNAALATQRSAQSPSYFRSVARLGVQAAEALEHAHQLGVVHRDIKPANLLVDRAGDLWITDFGLARLRAQTEITMSGDAVGTLRYMSPEQALAKRSLVDHRTDIYSLGATLYELLTLRPAYPGIDRQEVLHGIALGEPLSPRAIERQVPVELETIVLKAMAQEPARRYATARELADDLTRYLEHRPIAAVRPGMSERISKWIWRHRNVLLTATAIAALATVALSALTIRLWQEQTETRTALEHAQLAEREAQAGQDRAEANFRKALGGLDRLLRDLEKPGWGANPETASLRREIADHGIRIFQDYIDESGTDRAVRFQAARAYEMLTNMHLVARQFEVADKLHQKASGLLRHLAVEVPDNTEYGLALARACNGMANWDFSRGLHAAAQSEYQGSINALQKVLTYDRDGWIHNRLAFALCDCQEVELRNPATALTQARRALEFGPRVPAFWATLALAQYRSGDWMPARNSISKSMELGEAGPQHWFLLAMIDWRLGQAQQAQAWYGKADAWLKNNPMSDEVYHLRREASDVLGIRWP